MIERSSEFIILFGGIKMRRSFLLPVLILLVFLFSSPDLFAQKQDAEGNQLIEAPYTSVPPTIDGILSPGEWEGAESNYVDFLTLGVAGNAGPGVSDGVEDCSYTFSVMYDANYLYIAVAVKDDLYISTNYGQRLQWDMPVTWENDAIEYFFDGDLSRTETTCRNETETETGGQWIFGTDSEDSPLPFISPEVYGNKQRSYGVGSTDVWYAKTVENPDTADWTQEARFALAIFGSPEPGGEIGFNIAMDDVETYDEATLQPDQYAEYREIQLYWTAFAYDPGMIVTENIHELETFWGTLRFLEKAAVPDWDLF